MICVDIDQLTPCLIDANTGEIVETEVIRIVRKSFLKKYNEENEWYVNWDELLDTDEVYALVLKGTVSIQGLVALRYNPETEATYVHWIVASPDNNGKLTKNKKFIGVGGHLFSIAVDKAIEFGTNGEFYGYAANKELLDHYIDVFGAIPICVLHDYHFVIGAKSAISIKEEYTYDWTDEEI